jgi:hypothetical protein
MRNRSNQMSVGREGFSARRTSCARLFKSTLIEVRTCSQAFDCHRSITSEYVAKIFPCREKQLLLKISTEAARDATSGDLVLLARTFSSFNQFRDSKYRTEVHYQAAESIGSGVQRHDRYINDKMETADCQRASHATKINEFASGFFEEKPRGEIKQREQQIN